MLVFYGCEFRVAVENNDLYNKNKYLWVKLSWILRDYKKMEGVN
jgi:hypothetical protein